MIEGFVRNSDGLRVTVHTHKGGIPGFASPQRVADAFDRKVLPAGALLVTQHGRPLYCITIEPKGQPAASWHLVPLS